MRAIITTFLIAGVMTAVRAAPIDSSDFAVDGAPPWKRGDIAWKTTDGASPGKREAAASKSNTDGSPGWRRDAGWQEQRSGERTELARAIDNVAEQHGNKANTNGAPWWKRDDNWDNKGTASDFIREVAPTHVDAIPTAPPWKREQHASAGATWPPGWRRNSLPAPVQGSTNGAPNW